MVKINEEYFIDADKYNIILVKKSQIKEEKSKNFGEDKFEPIGYYSNIPDALKSLFNKKIKQKIEEKDFNSYNEFLKDLKDVEKKLSKDITALESNLKALDTPIIDLIMKSDKVLTDKKKEVK